MLRSLMITAAVFALGIGVVVAQEIPRFYDHNGSIVEFEWEESDAFNISYASPKEGLPVKVGTVLFEGEAVGNKVTGTAYVFSRKCGPIGYQVDGHFEGDYDTLKLTGPAPELDSNCNVVRYTFNSNAYLTFEVAVGYDWPHMFDH